MTGLVGKGLSLQKIRGLLNRRSDFQKDHRVASVMNNVRHKRNSVDQTLEARQMLAGDVLAVEWGGHLITEDVNLTSCRPRVLYSQSTAATPAIT